MTIEHLLKEIPGFRDFTRIPKNLIPVITDQPDTELYQGELQGHKIQPWLDDWLTPYQMEGIRYASERRRAFFIWPTGSGKTAASIRWAACRDYPLVVICRASATSQWITQINRFLVSHLGNTPPKVMSWEMMKKNKQELITLMKKQAVSLILDETQKAAQWRQAEKVYEGRSGSGRWVARDNIAGCITQIAPYANRILGLSWTPLDEVADLWAQLNLMEPGEWGSSWDFVHRYAGAMKGEYGGLVYANRPTNLRELKLRLTSLWHYVNPNRARAEMPECRWETHWIPIEDQDRPVAMERIIRKAKTPQDQIEARLEQASSRKTSFILNMVQDEVEADHKVVILHGRLKAMQALWVRLEKRFRGKAELFYVTSDKSASEIGRMVTAYRECRGPAIFLGSGYKIGESTDGLQCTDRLIIAMLPYDATKIEQWEGRCIYRQGQDRPCIVTYPLAVGVPDEDRLASILVRKIEIVLTVRSGGTLEDTLVALGRSDGDPLEKIIQHLDS